MTIGDLVDEIGGDESRTPDAIRVAAVHEAGHGVAACILRPGSLQALTLRSNGAEGGLTSSHWSGDLVRARDINARLIFLLAGRAAEEAFFREPSSGSGGDIASDLALATQLAVRASSVLGFDPGAGLVWSGWPDSAKVPDMMANDPALKERVRQTLDTAFADALTLIHRHRDAVDSVSNALMQRRALSGDTVADLVALHSGSVQHTLQGMSK